MATAKDLLDLLDLASLREAENFKRVGEIYYDQLSLAIANIAAMSAVSANSDLVKKTLYEPSPWLTSSRQQDTTPQPSGTSLEQ